MKTITLSTIAILLLTLFSCEKESINPEVVSTYDTVYVAYDTTTTVQLQEQDEDNPLVLSETSHFTDANGKITASTLEYTYDDEGVLIRITALGMQREVVYIAEYEYVLNTVVRTLTVYDSYGEIATENVTTSIYSENYL